MTGGVKMRLFLMSMLCLASTTGAEAASRYSITGIETANGVAVDASQINSNGLVTGTLLTNEGERHTYIYNGTTTVDLGTFGGTESRGVSLNDLGWVGGTYTANGIARPFIHDGNQLIDLSLLNGATQGAQVIAINNSGDALVYKFVFNPAPLPQFEVGAFLYDGTSVTNLNSTIPFPLALDLNHAGVMVGSGAPDGAQRAFIFDGTTAQYLSTFGGANSVASSISENGLVSGSSTDANGFTYGFIYDGQTMISLGSLGQAVAPGPFFDPFMSWGRAINDFGVVVGESRQDNTTDRAAFVYNNGLMENLNDLIDPDSGWVLNFALDINNSGQIVGTGTYNGQARGFVLTLNAVPEPASWFMLIVGFSLVGAGLRRSRLNGAILPI